MMRAARRLLQEVPAKRPSPANDIFALRRAPNSLHVAGMQSNTLSDHPVTHRAAQNELSFKQRKLMERGEFEKAAAVEADCLDLCRRVVSEVPAVQAVPFLQRK